MVEPLDPNPLLQPRAIRSSGVDESYHSCGGQISSRRRAARFRMLILMHLMDVREAILVSFSCCYNHASRRPGAHSFHSAFGNEGLFIWPT